MADKTGAEFYETLSNKETGGNYEKKRWETPLGQVHFESTKKAVQDIAIPFAQGARTFAEVGPGPGTWTSLFLNAYSTAPFTLIDISAEMLSQAKNALPQESAITYVHSDLLKYEPTAQVGFFFSSRAIEYIEDKEAALKKISHILAPDGRGFIITKCAHPWRDRLSRRTLPERHKCQTTPRRFIAQLRDAGFTIHDVGVAAVTIPLVHNPSLSTLVTSILQKLPSALVPWFLVESFWVSFKKVV